MTWVPRSEHSPDFLICRRCDADLTMAEYIELTRHCQQCSARLDREEAAFRRAVRSITSDRGLT